MTKKQYINILKRYIEKHFNTQLEAALHFGVSPTYLSLILMGERNPTVGMMDATGHYVRKRTTVSYLKKLN